MAKSNSEFKSIQKKLVAAVAMVLVASIMVVSSSYAWFTLSTAPEVTGIQTAVGSNGNLEMALRTQKDVGDIETSAGGINYPTTNNYWGNLVDLSDSSYHLDSVALAPARLNVVLDYANSTKGNTTYVVYDPAADKYAAGGTYNGEPIKTVEVLDKQDDPATEDVTETNYYKYTITTEVITQPVYVLSGGENAPYLKTPVYGTDGRLSALSVDNVINGTYLPEANGFAEQTEGSWGVRAIGTTSALTPTQMALRTAKRAVSNAINSSKDAAATSLREDAVDLAKILVNMYLVDGATVGEDDKAVIQKAIDGLVDIKDSLEVAMTQAVIAVGVAQNVTLTDEDISFGDGTINIGNGKSITWEGAESLEATLKAAADALYDMDGTLTTADGYVKESKYSEALSVMLDEDHFMIIDSDTGEDYTVSEMGTLAETSIMTAARIMMGTPTISINGGVYHDIALFSGNYSSKATMKVELVYQGMDFSDPIPVIMATNATEPSYSYTDGKGTTETNDDEEVTLKAFYLPGAYTELGKVNVSGEGVTSYEIITDIYGYAVDLAFRTNATGSNLLLQTEAKNRVEDSELTQGGGSYMQFTLDNKDFTWEQLVNLMMSVRVVFINDAGAVYGVAAMQDLVYEELVTIEYYMNDQDQYTDKEGNVVDEANRVIKNKTNVAYTENTPDHDLNVDGNAVKLTGCEAVTVGDKTYIKAPLQLYGFTLDAEGKMTLGDVLASNALTDLQQNVATAVTTVVYLDGDTVENSDVAISGNSMTGTMNLQFASDATLDPMDYTFTETKLEEPTVSFTDGKLTITAPAGNPGGVVYKLYTKVGTTEVSLNKTVTSGATIDGTTLGTLPDAVVPNTYTVYLKAEADGYTASNPVNAFNITVVEGGTYTVSAVSGG